MANNARRTPDLPPKTSANTSDNLLFIWKAANTTASQTAQISITNLLANTANLHVVVANLQVSNLSSNPTNSTSSTIESGVIFFSNTFLYVSVGNNLVKRVALDAF